MKRTSITIGKDVKEMIEALATYNNTYMFGFMHRLIASFFAGMRIDSQKIVLKIIATKNRENIFVKEYKDLFEEKD